MTSIEWTNHIYRTFVIISTVKKKSTWVATARRDQLCLAWVTWLKIENITHQIFRFHGVSDTVKYERIQIGLNKLENDLYRIKLVMDENVINEYKMRKDYSLQSRFECMIKLSVGEVGTSDWIGERFQRKSWKCLVPNGIKKRRASILTLNF